METSDLLADMWSFMLLCNWFHPHVNFDFKFKDYY